VAIEVNKIAPGMIDQYLGRTNYEAQQIDEPVEADRRDNLWSPIPGDHGSHGSFDASSHNFSTQAWLNTHRTWLLLAGVTGAVFGALFRRKVCTSSKAISIRDEG
jgi:hypothetical protein